MAAALERAMVPPDAVAQVLAGCVTQVGEQAYNVGRIAWLTAGLPETTPGSTLDAQCGSSQQAFNLAAALIRSDEADVVVVGGIELMSRQPLGSNVMGGTGDPLSERYRDRYEVTTQGEAAERIADRWQIDREECDTLALRSQQLAAGAWENKNFDEEVIAVNVPDGDGGEGHVFVCDETFRPTTREGLAALRPVFRPDGRHTAGNSSQISDGAAAAVLVSERAACEYALRPLGEVVAGVMVGVDPTIKLTGPIPATAAILRRAGVAAEDVAVFEVNEAFASVLAAWLRETEIPLERVNLNGGAIALGHPVGATGVRLCATALHALRRRGGGQALVTMCCGGGLGTATLLRAGDLAT